MHIILSWISFDALGFESMSSFSESCCLEKFTGWVSHTRGRVLCLSGTVDRSVLNRWLALTHSKTLCGVKHGCKWKPLDIHWIEVHVLLDHGHNRPSSKHERSSFWTARLLLMSVIVQTVLEAHPKKGFGLMRLPMTSLACPSTLRLISLRIYRLCSKGIPFSSALWHWA